MTLSLRNIAACLGVHGDFSVRHDIFIFAAGSPTHSLRKVLTAMRQDCEPYIEMETLLSVKAAASITKLAIDPAGFLHTISFDVELTNLIDQTVNVYNSAVLLTDSGGSVHMSMPLYGSNSPMAGQSNYIPAHQTQAGSFTYFWGGGPFNLVISIWAQGGPESNLQQIVRRVPILRDGYHKPAVIQVPMPVYIGLWSRPVEAFKVWRTDHQATWLMLAGHIVNLYMSSITVDGWHLTIHSNGSVLLDQELPHGFYSIQSGNDIPPENGKMVLKEQLSGFIFGAEMSNLPGDLSGVTAKLVLRYTRQVGSGPQKAKAIVVAPIKHMTPTVLRAPVKAPAAGNWQWGNAPDHTTHDAHAWSGERYCYDLVIVHESGKTFSGDCTTKPDGTHAGACTHNSNFFAYGHPVFASAKGTVKLSVDNLDENFGFDANPATKGGNWVVLQHDDGAISGYFHLRKGKNQVTETQMIATGKQVGESGNSGSSSEPHLHFGYVTLHSTGRGVISPVAFSNLKTTSGQDVTVVPGFGLYRS